MCTSVKISFRRQVFRSAFHTLSCFPVLWNDCRFRKSSSELCGHQTLQGNKRIIQNGLKRIFKNDWMWQDVFERIQDVAQEDLSWGTPDRTDASFFPECISLSPSTLKPLQFKSPLDSLTMGMGKKMADKRLSAPESWLDECSGSALLVLQIDVETVDQATLKCASIL